MISRSKWLLSAAVVVLSVAAVAQAGSDPGIDGNWAAPTAVRDLLDVQVDGTAEGIVVRLTTDGEVPFESFVIDSPDRLVPATSSRPREDARAEQYA